MSLLRITCPHCGFSRDVPAEKLPDQPVQANCPKCKQSFSFSKAEAPEAPQAVTPPPPPEPPPMSVAEPPPPPQSPRAPQADSNNTRPRSSRLLSVGELLSAAWNSYKQRWLLLIAIMIATAVAVIVPPALVALGLGGVAKESFTGMVAMFMLMGLAVLLSLGLACWGGAAVLSAALDETLGFKDSFGYANSCWLSLAWASSLYSFIVGGASLLFVIPGILTGVWFFACSYLVVAEKNRGMEALLKSKALVEGRFWPVLGRLLLVGLLGGIVGMVPLIGPVFSLLFAPFSILFSVLLYRNLHETANLTGWNATDGAKAGWLLLGLSGYILMPLLLFLLLGAAFFAAFEPFFKMMLQQGKLQHVLSFGSSLMQLGF